MEGRSRPICQRCGSVIYFNLKVGAGVLVERGGGVLLTRRAIEPGLGHWCLPAGFVEYDESPAEAALRECLEETGFLVELDGLQGVYYYSQDPRGNGILVMYRAHIVGGELAPGDDADQARFFSPDGLPEDISFRAHRQVLAEWTAQALEAEL